MEKKVNTITDVEQIIKLNFPTEENKSIRYFYRGISNKEYKLISKISRAYKKEGIASSSCIIDRYNNLKEYLKTFLPSYGVDLPPYSNLRDWVELFSRSALRSPN